MKELFHACHGADIKLGIVTRNTRESVDCLCAKFSLEVDTIVTREFLFIKPHPAPILHILEQWQMSPDRVLTIGDYVHDIECGRAAGTKTCFFQNPGKPDYGQGVDHVVSSIPELWNIVLGRRVQCSGDLP